MLWNGNKFFSSGFQLFNFDKSVNIGISDDLGAHKSPLISGLKLIAKDEEWQWEQHNDLEVVVVFVVVVFFVFFLHIN